MTGESLDRARFVPDLRIPVRDGTRLAADVYLPDTTGPAPALLAASPYQKDLRHLPTHPLFAFRETGPIGWYVEQGYAYVWLDLRGTGRSAGSWTFGGRREGEDLYDVIEWIAHQPWCNGRVGMIGQSYFAMAQWNAARMRPPHLACIAPYDGNVDIYRDFLYHGGIFCLGFAASWATRLALMHYAQGHPPADPPDLRDALAAELTRHAEDDDWMRDRSPYWELDRVTTPVLSIGCWGKGPIHLRGNVLGYERVTGPRKLLITGAAGVAEAQRRFADPAFHEAELLPWYDQHLKGIDTGVLDGPPVKLWMRGEEAYRELDDWPPAGPALSMYLCGQPAGQARSLNDGSLTVRPPGSDGGRTSWHYPREEWAFGVTAADAAGRPDHLAGITTWTSPPFDRDTELTGWSLLELYLSSDQADADVYAKLRHVAANGGAALVTQGWLRASHRAEEPILDAPLRTFHTHRAPNPLVPGQVYRLRMELLPSCYLIPAGDRLRLELTNGDSPVQDGPFTHDYGLKSGVDTYHHDAAHPSRLLLPLRER